MASSTLSNVTYALSSHYAGASLLSSFDFFTGDDRSNGFVNYLDENSAMAHGLVSVQEGNHVRLGVDSTTVLSTNDTGRPSVMLTSRDSFTHGLFIADFEHMPASSCGSWPSFWAFNNNTDAWPKGGEIGIVEGANNAIRNLYSAHTDSGCALPEGGFLGSQGSEQCDSQKGQIGCNYAAPARDPTSYGDAFNAAGGGVYALEWDDEFLKMWHFPRAGVPADIQVGRPQPSGWGLPHALFGGSGCDADTYFYNMSLVLNINFCGNYAGGLWRETESCGKLASTCEAYVAGHPEAYTEAYWDVRYIDVYQKKVPRAKSDSRPDSSSPRPSARPQLAAHNVLTKTVTLSKAPAPTTGPLGLKTIGRYVLLGCFESDDGYPTFDEAMNSTSMTNSMCISKCTAAGKRYSGVQADTCYCASELGDASAQTPSSCTTPCPGDGSQFCGGPGRKELSYSAASPGPAGRFTVYGNLAKEPPPPDAPGKGRDGADGVVVTRVAYTDICSAPPPNPARLCEYGYYATLTNPEEAGGGVATVPMTTITQTCDACGPKNESTVTLTVPEAVVTSDVVVTIVQTVLPLVDPVGTTGFPSAAAATATGQTQALLGTASGLSASIGGFGTLSILMTLWLGVLGAVVLF